MPVIAMTREMGSLGKDVALAVAEDLGLELMQHQLVSHIADKMHMQESAVDRYLEHKDSMFERWRVSDHNLSLYTSEEILDVAAKGNVLIRGWGATYVLRLVPHVLCVRVCAPAGNRAHVLMERIGLGDYELALKEITRNDAAHAHTMLSLFHVDWEDPLLYDLVLNTEHMSVPTCVEVIKHALAQDDFKETPDSLAILEHKRLEARVQAALRNDSRTAHPSLSFEVTVVKGTGQVMLTGYAFDADFKQAAEEVARGVPEVTEVNNQLLLIKSYAGP